MSEVRRDSALEDNRLATFLGRVGLTPAEWTRVRRVPLFAGLAADDLARLLRHARVREFARNTLLFNQGDEADRFFVVLEGWVRLYRVAGDGNEVTIHLFGRGESLAEAALLASGRYPVNGLAVDRSRLLVIPGDAFLAALREDRELCLAMMASMARRLQGFVGQIEQLSYRSTTERLAAFLINLAPVEDGACEIHLPIDKALIAARLGMQPETLSRAFARLRRHGVETSGSQVRIADLGALRRIVDDGAA